MKNTPQQFYDTFLNGEKINRRHRMIHQWLVKLGLQDHHSVLEVGCGPGTVSTLVMQSLGVNGFLHGIDISTIRVQAARARLIRYEDNTFFEQQDIRLFKSKHVYDVIFFPDSLEHIPADDHVKVFLKLEKILQPGGFLMIHVPDPLYLDHIREHEPHRLQPLDQSLYPDHLYKVARMTGFYITHLQSYKVWRHPAEYQVICMKKKDDVIRQYR